MRVMWVLYLALLATLSGFASAQTYLYCTDSDAGLTYNLFGRVNYSSVSFPQPNEIQTAPDRCLQGLSNVSSCTGDTCYIAEYYCGGTNPSYTVNYSLVTCTSLGYAGCNNGACYGVAPQPTCSDGVRNQDETDVDCGGSRCGLCSTGDACIVSSDCASSICNNGACYGPDPYITLERGRSDPGNHTWLEGAIGENIMMQLNVSARVQNADITGFMFLTRGSGNEHDAISEARLYRDDNENGRPDDGELLDSTSLSDNGAILFQITSLTIPSGHSVHFLISYQMTAATHAFETFTLRWGSVDYAYENREGTMSRGSSAPLENTKLIIPDTSRTTPNEPFDNESCTPTNGCTPDSVLCDAQSRTGYLCLSGILTPVGNAYDAYCPSSDGCTPGEWLCFQEDRSAQECLLDGTWGNRLQLDSVYNLHCSDTCVEGTGYCFDETRYTCRQGRYETDGVCSEPVQGADECNSGTAVCSGAQEGSYRCVENRRVEMNNEEYAQLCGGIEANGCTPDDKRCNPLTQHIEVCAQNAWMPTGEPNSAEYQQMCSTVECNDNWFSCNPATRMVSFCSNHQWLPPSAERFTEVCAPRVSVGSPDQVLIGELNGNKVIKYKYLPGAMQKVDNLILKKVVQWKVPWWLIILFLIGGIFLGYLYARLKYFNYDNLSKKALKKKK